MKLEQITLSNIKSFFQGYSRYYLDKIKILPQYTREQVFYRIWVCKDSCIPFRKCEVCGCSAIEKSYATKSCSLEKFPNLVSKERWEEYKKGKQIDEILLQTIMEEVELIFIKK